MMGVRMVCAGKLKEKHYIDACREYEKRLGVFCKLEIIEIAEERGGDGLVKEGKRILELVSQGMFVIALCIEGEGMTSEQLAAKLESLQNTGVSRLCIIIGSSNGLDDTVKRRADLRMSMSDMTFPHHLARVMALEQIYRAFSIIGGGKYHK